jgi:hypothetical protein
MLRNLNKQRILKLSTNKFIKNREIYPLLNSNQTRFYSEKKDEEELKKQFSFEKMAKKSKLADSLIKPPTYGEKLKNLGNATISLSFKIVKMIPVFLWKATVFLYKRLVEIVQNPYVVKEWYQNIKKSTSHMIHHYWVGSKLLYADIKTSTKLLKKVMKGVALSRREKNQVKKEFLTKLFR